MRDLDPHLANDAPETSTPRNATSSIWGASQLLWLVVIEDMDHAPVTPLPVDLGCLLAVPLLSAGLRTGYNCSVGRSRRVPPGLLRTVTQ